VVHEWTQQIHTRISGQANVQLLTLQKCNVWFCSSEISKQTALLMMSWKGFAESLAIKQTYLPSFRSDAVLRKGDMGTKGVATLWHAYGWEKYNARHVASGMDGLVV